MVVKSLDKILVIPFYCPRCRKFSFFHHNLKTEEIGIIETIEDPWTEHFCALHGGEEFWGKEYIQKLKAIPWDETRIPFKRRKIGLERTGKKIFSGIVLSVETMVDNTISLRLLSENEDVLDAIYSGDHQQLCAGILLDLSGMTPLKGGKFRLTEIKQILIDKSFEKQTGLKEYYELNLRGKDPEQLEISVNQLLYRIRKENGRLLAIVPLPLVSEEGELRFGRRIILLPKAKLIDIFNGFTFPKGIDFGFNQKSI